jgi:excisionase family DNA binding protein
MITTTQAATILDKHPATVWRMARDRRIPSVKVGNRYRFDELTLRVFAATGRLPRRPA